MKTNALFTPFCCLVLLVVSLSTSSQQVYNPYTEKDSTGGTEKVQVPGVFLVVDGGFNYYTGLVGLGLEIPFNAKTAIFGRAGLGGWGFKYGTGFRFMPGGLYGLSFDAGFAQAAGGVIEDIEMDVERYSTSRPVDLELLPASTINLGINYYWKVGRHHKFGIGSGYAIPVKNDRYEVTSGETLTEESELLMQMLQPGGLMFNLVFLIGII